MESMKLAMYRAMQIPAGYLMNPTKTEEDYALADLLGEIPNKQARAKKLLGL